MNIATVQNFLPFSVNGSEKVRIDNAGNVGIGTSAPTVLLDVSGAAKVRGALDMTSQNITNLAAPTISTDVSTKGYVDGVSAVFANLGASATSDAGSNTRIGAAALSVVTGGNNTAIGKSAGATVTSGTQNVYVGSLAAASSATATNEIAIGYNVAGLGSNTAVIGNSSISTTVLRGNVGIGTTTPGAVLDVSGSAKIRGALDLSTQNITNANQISATTNLVLQPNGGNICIGRTTSSTGSMFDLSNSVGIRTRYSTSDTSLTLGVWPTTTNSGDAFMWNEYSNGKLSLGCGNYPAMTLDPAGIIYANYGKLCIKNNQTWTGSINPGNITGSEAGITLQYTGTQLEGSNNNWTVVHNGNNDLIFRYNAGDMSYINNAGTNKMLNFTGCHRCYIDEPSGNIIPGMVVYSVGLYNNIFYDTSNNPGTRYLPQIGESLPVCKFTTIAGDKRVFGIVGEKEIFRYKPVGDKTVAMRTYNTGGFIGHLFDVSMDDPIEVNRWDINSLGEGAVLVVRRNADTVIENGDLIMSSDLIAGYAEVQTDNTIKNITIGKLTCGWNDTLIDVKIVNGFETKLLGCVYYCG